MKSLISFLLRHVPRAALQRVSHYALAVVALFLKGDNVHCPICRSSFRKFLPYGRVGRSNVLCPSCLSLERHRLIWLYLERETIFFESQQRMLHIAPEYCFIRRFKRLPNTNYTSGDLFSPLADVKMDIHQIPFDDDTFDVVFCNHVLEHVEDDKKSIREIYRVMKPGGWAILQIPLFYPLPEKTFEDPSINEPGDREKAFGQDDHVRKYGMDYKDRLIEAGFKLRQNYTRELTESEMKRYALDPGEILFVATKPKHG